MFINTKDGYITSFGKAENEEKSEEYVALENAMSNRPNPREGYDYKLKTDLTWEEYELPKFEEETTEKDEPIEDSLYGNSFP